MGADDYYDNFEDNGKVSKKDVYKKSYGGALVLVSVLFMIFGALTVILALFVMSNNPSMKIMRIVLGAINFILGFFLVARKMWAYYTSIIYLSLNILLQIIAMLMQGKYGVGIVMPIILLLLLIRNKSEMMVEVPVKNDGKQVKK